MVLQYLMNTFTSTVERAEKFQTFETSTVRQYVCWYNSCYDFKYANQSLRNIRIVHIVYRNHACTFKKLHKVSKVPILNVVIFIIRTIVFIYFNVNMRHAFLVDIGWQNIEIENKTNYSTHIDYPCTIVVY